MLNSTREYMAIT